MMHLFRQSLLTLASKLARHNTKVRFDAGFLQVADFPSRTIKK